MLQIVILNHHGDGEREHPHIRLRSQSVSVAAEFTGESLLVVIKHIPALAAEEVPH